MHPPRTIDVDRVLDRGPITGYQKWLVSLTALTIVFDGIDNQLLGLAIPSLMAEWSVDRAGFAPVVSLSYLGMMVGGAIAGLAGDRVGRKTALLASMALFSAATLAIATADSMRDLAILRLVAGLGLGGAMPNAAALAAEYVPVVNRPLAVTVTIVSVPLGAMLAGAIAIAAIPTTGWRGMFALGGIVPLAASAGLVWLMPESPRYLVRRRRRWPELAAFLARVGHQADPGASFLGGPGGQATPAGVAALFGRDILRDTLSLWVSFFSCLLSVYLALAWLPTIIAGSGLSPAAAGSAISMFNLGGVVGAVLGGAAITRFGSRPTMIAMSAGAVVGALALSRMPIGPDHAVLPLLAMLAVTGGLINGVQTTMYALAAHVYPTAMRATGVGAAVSIGRSGAILSGYAGPWALSHGGSASFFGLMACAVLVTCVGLALTRRHVPGSQ